MTKLKLAINARKACLKKNKSKKRNFQKDKEMTATAKKKQELIKNE